MKSAEFRRSFEEQMSLVEQAVDAFPWEDEAAYGNWCAQTYYYVCHSTRLLALCAGLTPLDRNDFHYRFAKHIREESGHENLALKDVTALGFGLTDFPLLPQTSAFFQTQYYYVEHVHPFAFFGYIVMLEGAAAKIGGKIVARTQKAHAQNCRNFISVHSEEDQQHIKEALHLIDKMTPDEISAVHENFLNSCDNYIGIMEACRKTAEQRRRRAS